MGGYVARTEEMRRIQNLSKNQKKWEHLVEEGVEGKTIYDRF
jgi:hypothetical protein